MSDAQVLIPRDLLKLWLAFGQETPMPPSLRRYMEARMGTGLQDVRIHTGAVAAHLCNTLKARALTLGNDILFADGEYEPYSPEGRWLLAHELVHVLQQRAAGGPVLSWRASWNCDSAEVVALGDDNDPCEDEADRLAAEVIDGGLQSAITPDHSGAIRGTRRQVTVAADAHDAPPPRATFRPQLVASAG